MYPDTPIPQEEPAGQNPLDGAVINYYLNDKANNISLEISDDKNNVVRKYSSADTMYKIGDVNIPHYWIRPQQILSAAAGSHRFMWDMHYAPLNVPPSYPISATYMNTAPDETSPWVLPGMYTAKLTIDGKTTTQNFEVKMDPRVQTSDYDLKDIHSVACSCYSIRQKSMGMLNQLGNLHLQIKNNLPKTNSSIAKQLNNLDSLITLLERNTSGSDLNKLNGDAARLFGVINDNDMPPTLQAKEAVVKTQADFAVLVAKWENLNNEIKKVNAALGKTKLPLLKQ